MEDMGQLYTRLLDSGTDLELEHFGTRVINTLRIEKGEFILTLKIISSPYTSLKNITLIWLFYSVFANLHSVS